ncbi:MAG: class I SAM-dependent methyltransferase [Pelagibacteraceae bacterium]|jgi:methylation protein EvaC|nr:class I SAM-dependent methyltransferase [Pelagibacteraceae bacterium]|tara:strand:- start:502 stop:1692 length:1191 start_codon:yes stop_codon:yes gene_type:complete
MKCKVTGKKIDPFMSFGRMPIANGFLNKDKFNEEFFFEMEVGFSDDLSLFQLNDHPKPTMMFNENYPFFTGSSQQMKLHFKNYANWIKKYHPNTIKNIIEIGSNDGTFLKNFNSNDYNTLGFEPSDNVAERASKGGVNTINEFFNKNSVINQKNFINNTDLICAANVICHVPDLNDLIQAVCLMLNKSGLFIFEEPYLGSMFEKISYDQIYDEHIFIFSVTSISKIFKLFDMELVDVFPQTTHGGSMRYITGRKNIHKISDNVNTLLEKEKLKNLDNISSCKKFKNNCELSKIKTRKSLLKFKDNNYKIAGYAATSKSTTILNYCNINSKIIDYICDTTPEKIGKFSPGTHIPIVNMYHFKKFNPDVAYLFAWNHKDEILKKEKNYKGKWFSHVAL